MCRLFCYMIHLALLQPDVQAFLSSHERDDSRKIALLTKTIGNIPAALLAAQIAGRQKASVKIPAYYHAKHILYPPSLNLEQSSSELTAQYKARLLSKIFSEQSFDIADLTGGFGIDSFFFSRIAKKVWHVEPNTELQQIARHNHLQLDAANIEYVNTAAESFLTENKWFFDAIYLDPSRRLNHQKVFSLAECEPNVPLLLDSLFERSATLLIKASPLLDLSAAIQNLRGVKQIHVVSVENECKELLFLCVRGFTAEPEIFAVNILSNDQAAAPFTFFASAEENLSLSFGEPQSYLYEPNASVLKAGAFKSITQAFPIVKLAPSTHIYTAPAVVPDFPGRIFKIEQLVKSDPKFIENLLPDKKANVLTRNYPLSVEAIKKKLKIKDGGSLYIIGFSSVKQKYLALCSRVQ